MKKIIFAVLILFIIIFSFIFKNNSAAEIKYNTVKVEKGAIQNAFYLAGNLAYRNQARLSSELVARVSQIYVQEGDSVEKGQILIKLDDSSVKAEILQMQAQVAKAKIEIERAKRDVVQKETEWGRQNELLAKGMASKQALDNAVAALENARFQLESNEKNSLQSIAALVQREKQLEKTIIRSPIKGVVIAIPIKVGETAVASATSLAGSSLMTIADLASMVVEAQVAEFDIARIKLGQVSMMTTRAIPNETFVGKVARIARSVSNDTKATSDNKAIRTVAVQIELERSHPQFISGMSCDLSLVNAAQENAMLIPLTALRMDEVETNKFLQAREREYYVWKVKNGRAIKSKIEIGYADEHKQEVRSGLALGDEIISGPIGYLQKLHDGDQLSVANRP